MTGQLIMRPGLDAKIDGVMYGRDSRTVSGGRAPYVPPPVPVPLVPTFGGTNDGFQVLVWFNKPVTPSGSIMPGYLFQPGGGQRTVDNMVQLQPNLVKLMLSASSGDGPYQVTVPASDLGIVDADGQSPVAGSYLFATGN